MAINILHQIKRNRVFQTLVPISAVPPFRAGAWPAPPVRGDNNHVANFMPRNQLVGCILKMSGGKPVIGTARRAMQDVQDWIAPRFIERVVVRWWQVDGDLSLLSSHRRAGIGRLHHLARLSLDAVDN